MNKINKSKRVRILNSYISSISFNDLCEEIFYWIKNKEKRYICVSAVHACILAYKDIAFSKAYNNADIVAPDGRPLFWALKLLGHNYSEHLRGEFLTRNITKFAAVNNFEVGFYGGKKNSIDKCINVLKNENKNLNISYTFSPPSPFTDLLKEKDIELINKINSSKTKILFVALGCPVQELWMESYKKDLNCICIGIGAAVDFISGEKISAPNWIQKLGLEWLLRLISEPRRLFWRYFSTNFLFIFLFFLQITGLKKFK